jgi:hypothetical protein
MMTSEPACSGGEDEPPLTLWLEDSPASPSVQPDAGWPRMIRAGFGQQWRKSFADYDPATRSWRTFQGSLFAEWETFSGSWPRAGMTRNGIAYQRPPSAPLIRETASGSSPETPEKWPTPRTFEVMSRDITPHRIADRFPNLETVMARRLWPELTAELIPEPPEDVPALWPTPKGSAANYGRPRENDRGDLQAAVMRWPTPRAQNGESRNSRVWRRPDGQRQNLENVLAVREPAAIGGHLNPTWVEWLMGYPPGWTDCAD